MSGVVLICQGDKKPPSRLWLRSAANPPFRQRRDDKTQRGRAQRWRGADGDEG